MASQGAADAASELRKIAGRCRLRWRLLPGLLVVEIDEVVPVRDLVVHRATGGSSRTPQFMQRAAWLRRLPPVDDEWR